MSESFTAVEYAVLAHLRSAGKSTVPAIAADLLLLLGETEEAVSRLAFKGLAEKDGNAYSASPVAMNVPLMEIRKTTTGRLAPVRQAPPPPAPAPDVAMVFKNARERAQRERAGGGL